MNQISPLQPEIHRYHFLSQEYQEINESLFIKIYLWYFCPREDSYEEIVSAATKAYKNYQLDQTFPEFFWRVQDIRISEELFRSRQGIDLDTELSRLEQILQEGVLRFPETAFKYDPTFWKWVFKTLFHREPTGDKDPLWDTLFRFGIPILHPEPTEDNGPL